MRFTVDLIRVESDCGEHRAVAHVVARGRLWSGPTVVAMGGSHLGVWYLGPRAHPNDGLIDMTEGELGWRQRLIARRRAVTGTHVPHPALHQRRVRGARIDLARRRQLWIDGVRVGSTRWLAVTVQPDALTVVLPAAP